MSEQVTRKWPMSEHVRMLVSLLDEEYGRDPNKFTAEQAALNAAIDALDRPTPPAAGGEMGEAVADGWEFQHEETGLTTILMNDGVNNETNFAKNNPRHQYVGPIYRHPHPSTPVAAGGVVVPDWTLIQALLLGIASEAYLRQPAMQNAKAQAAKIHDWLAAAPQQAAQGGMKLVPLEPTYQMAEAMGVKWEAGEGFPARYRRMLAAVP